MAIKYKYEKQEEIPKEFAAEFEEKEEGGKKLWILKIDGVIESSKLDEFRNNNKRLHKELTDLTTKFEGIDPDEARQLSATVGGLKPEELTEVLKKGKDIEKVVDTRTKAMREDHDKALTALRNDRDRVQRRLEAVEIAQATVTEATKRGLKATAAGDIIARASGVFKLNADSKPVAYEADGKTVMYGKDGLPLTINEWVEKMLTEAPHLFEESKGGGSGGGDDKGKNGTSGPNPFKKGEHYNRTEQMKLVKLDPAKARRLALEAGVRLPEGI